MATFQLTDAEFQSQVLESAQPVLVDFSATHCAPCRALAPVLEQLAQQYAGKLKIAELNCDDEQESAQRYGIRAFPTLLFFKGGKVVDQLVGAPPKSKLEAAIQKVL
jgi:thioredoxin 1